MRILIVEDERDLGLALRSVLEQTGYAVDLVHNGEDGLAMATGLPYDLVLLDRLLPGLDGVTICRRLREAGHVVPVIMLTALDAVAHRVEGLDAGADDYLVKPFELAELQARVRARLRPRSSAQAKLLAIADLELDLETGVVRRAGGAIALSRKEFTLLAHLMRQPGRLFTKEQLLDHVWDSDSEPGSDVVRAQIKNLRKKVDDPFERKLIRTVYGMGYKVEA